MTTSAGSAFARSAVSAIAAATAGRVRRSSGRVALLPPDGEGDAVPPGLVAVAAGVVGVGEPGVGLAGSSSLEKAQALVASRATVSATARWWGVRIGTPGRRGVQYLDECPPDGVPTGCGTARASAEHVPADDQSLDLVGALEDLGHLRLAHVPLGREVR